MSYADQPSEGFEPPMNKGEPQTIGQLLTTISTQFAALIRGELELVQANLSEKALRLRTGGILIAAAGVLALYMLGMILLGAAWALTLVMPVWAAFLVVAGVLLVIVVVLLAVGGKAIARSKEYEIDPTVGLKRTVEAAKMGIRK